MNSKFKNKIFDINNSNNNTIWKSQKNIFIDIEQYNNKNNFSSSKYKNKTKENIEKFLNKSLNDFTINYKNEKKKSYFDNIKTSFNKNNIIIQHKEFDYDSFLSKMIEKRKEKNNNKLINNKNENTFNEIRKNISQNNIFKNNLLNKINKFTSELRNPYLGKYKIKELLNFNNNSHLNILILSKGYLSPQNRYNNNNLYINKNYNKSKSLKYTNNNYNKIYIRDERDKIIDKFMKKNEKINNDYFSNQKNKNIIKKLNLNF